MIKIRLTFDELVMLHDAFRNKKMDGSGPHFDLLLEHLAEFTAFFEKLIYRGQDRYRVSFSSLQCRAFMQLWLHQELPNYAAWIINYLIATFDKASKQPKLLQ